MNDVVKIIFDTLSAGKGINLPGTGSLYVEREPAKFISKYEITPPLNKVRFSKEEKPEYENITDILAREGKIEKASADRKYRRWLKQASSEEAGVLEITDVGVLKGDVFYPAVALHEKLNPLGESSVTVKKKSKGGFWTYYLLGLCILLAIALLLVISLRSDLPCANRAADRAGKKEQRIERVEARRADRVARSARRTIARHEREKQANENREARYAKRMAEENNNAAGKVSDNAAESSAAAEEVAANASESKSVEDVIQGQLEDYARAASQENANAGNCPSGKEQACQDVDRKCVPAERYHLVIGVFSDPNNADKLINEDYMRLGRSAYSKYPFKDGKVFVSIYSSDDKAAVERRLRELYWYNPEMWIYSAR